MRQTFFFIRHAQADYHPGRLYGWTPGVHLSAEGRDQAKRLAERLEPVPFRAIYSSPLERCIETAEILAEGRRRTIETIEDLGEVRYGRWQGKTFKSLAKTRLWRTVQLNPSEAVFPGGESIRELQGRGVEAVEQLRRKHRRGVVAIVSHADMIKAIAAHYLGMHLDLFQRLVIEPASATVITFAGDFPRLVRLGDTGRYEAFRPAKKP